MLHTKKYRGKHNKSRVAHKMKKHSKTRGLKERGGRTWSDLLTGKAYHPFESAILPGTQQPILIVDQFGNALQVDQYNRPRTYGPDPNGRDQRLSYHYYELMKPTPQDINENRLMEAIQAKNLIGNSLQRPMGMGYPQPVAYAQPY
jgi:hypothetical protein